MLKLAGYHVGEDFHIAVGVEREASHRTNLIVVHDAEGLKPYVLRIEVIREGKRETGLKPAMIGLAPILSATRCEFGFFGF